MVTAGSGRAARRASTALSAAANAAAASSARDSPIRESPANPSETARASVSFVALFRRFAILREISSRSRVSSRSASSTPPSSAPSMSPPTAPPPCTAPRAFAPELGRRRPRVRFQSARVARRLRVAPRRPQVPARAVRRGAPQVRRGLDALFPSESSLLVSVSSAASDRNDSRLAPRVAARISEPSFDGSAARRFLTSASRLRDELAGDIATDRIALSEFSSPEAFSSSSRSSSSAESSSRAASRAARRFFASFLSFLRFFVSFFVSAFPARNARALPRRAPRPRLRVFRFQPSRRCLLRDRRDRLRRVSGPARAPPRGTESRTRRARAKTRLRTSRR